MITDVNYILRHMIYKLTILKLFIENNKIILFPARSDLHDS